MAIYLIRLGLVALLLTMSAAQADQLQDPTMPPVSDDGQAISQATTVTRPVLQSITLSSPNKFAMISGEPVQLGQQYQQYTLTQLTANDAVLRDVGGQLLHLKMDFQIQKKLSGK